MVIFYNGQMSQCRQLKPIVPLVILFSLGQWGCRGKEIRERPVRVACVGDSVTFGTNIAERKVNCWPARLQALLGPGYRVGNFGLPGATLLARGYRPYAGSRKYRKALAFNADIVIISLGLNDNDPGIWPRHGGGFFADYVKLVGAFRGQDPEKKRVFICRLTPVFDAHLRVAAGIPDYYALIQGEIERVARECPCPLIDLHAPLRSRADLFPDALHPDAGGALIIARKVYQELQQAGLVRR
jgi:sialate O-acetylesterase